jgi:hypothetical protein
MMAHHSGRMHKQSSLGGVVDRTHLPYSDRSAVIRGIRDQLLSRRIQSDEPVPSVTQICQLINTIFWASLATEEGQYAKLAVAVIEEDELDISEGIVFADSLPFSAAVLVKLSPALQAENSYLTVSFGKGARLRIRGLTQGHVLGPVIRATSPGNIVVSRSGEILAYLSPVQEPVVLEIPDWVMQVAGFVGRPFEPNFEMAWFLRFLAEAMRHGRGGTILIVPSSATRWQDSLKDGYLVAKDELRLMRSKKRWVEKSKETTDTSGPGPSITYLDPLSSEAMIFRRKIAFIGRLTAVDGATILDEKYEVIGFGQKIVPRREPPATIEVANLLGESAAEESLPFKEIGGTRHQSAACFANEYAESVAFVTSQDGRMTLLRSADYGLRALRRCETLLPGD